MFERAPKLEKTFRRYPQAPLFARLADHYLHKGRLMRAQSLCEEGCERFPAYPTGFFVLGLCYERQRMWEEARTALDRGLRLDPDNPAGYRRLARIYTEIGNQTLALKCLERAATLDPLSETLGLELEQMLMSVRDGARGDAVTPVEEVPAPLPEAPPAPVKPPPTVPEVAQSPSADEVVADDEPTPPESEVVAEEDEGLFDEDVDSGLDEALQLLEDDEVEDSHDERPEEPFGKIQLQPEWDDAGTEIGEVSGYGDVDEPEPEPVEEAADVPPGDDEVAALGEGLFEGDDAAQPGLTTRRPPVRGASKPAAQPAAAEAKPLPVDLVSEVDDAPVPEREPVPRVSQLRGRHTKELTALLLEFQDSADPVEDTEAIEELGEPVATLTLADLYVQQGHHEQALEVYQRVLSADPDNETARRSAAKLSAT
jgi:tetratricopeptide (TPR) repeat protein